MELNSMQLFYCGDAWALGSLLYGGRSHLVTAEAEQYRYRPYER